MIERRNELDYRIKGLEAELKSLEIKIDQLPEVDVVFLRKQRKERLEYRDSLTKEQSINEVKRNEIAKAKKLANDEWNGLTAQQKKFQRVRCRLDATSDTLDVIAASYKAIEDEEISVRGRIT